MALFSVSGEKQNLPGGYDSHELTMRRKGSLVCIERFGPDDNPSYRYRDSKDPEAILYLKRKNEKETEELKEAKWERFLTMGFENQDEEDEFFRLAILWKENPDIFENLDLKTRERMLELGILDEYCDTIALYTKETQIIIEENR